MDNFTAFDFVCLVLLLIFTIRCAIRGFITEIMSMASFVLGLLAALFFFKKGGEIIQERFMPNLKTLADVIAFILLFVLVFAIVKFLESILKEIVEGIKLGKADRYLGVLFGLLEGFIVVSLVIFLISIQPLFDSQKVLNNSFFADMILPLITGVREAAVEITLQIIPCRSRC